MGIRIHLVYYFIERWLGTTMDEVAPINRISHIDKDVLLVHGTKDQIIPYSDSVSLKAKCLNNENGLLKIENRGHFDILRDQLLWKNVVEFING